MLSQLYNRACHSIISPQKFTHRIQSYCPPKQKIGGRTMQRIDFTIKNKKDKQISCLILTEEGIQPQWTILYLHGNGGSKLECLGLVDFVCKNQIAVVGFDFVGCGNSDTGFLTYGYNQSVDAQDVLEQAKKYVKIKKLGVWGRSMGAATAIMMAQKRKIPIQCLILDSPFPKLSKVIQRVIKTETQMPSSLCMLATYLLSQQINRKLSLQLFEIDYLEHYRKVSKQIPTLFFYSNNDKIVQKEEVFMFYNCCKSHKNLVEIFQLHEEERGFSVFDEGVQWIKSIPEKKANKLKLAYMTDGLEIQSSAIRTSRGFCCCSGII